MRTACIAILCAALSISALAQTDSNEPPSRDDIILYLQTMHSHDMMQRVMETQAESMHQLYRDLILKEKGSVPADFDTKFKKEMDDLIKNMPIDEIQQAMIPSYQQHFSKSDIEAMNSFYSSPVGQKVLEELPEVLKEGNQAAMPILTKYISEWKDRVKADFADTSKAQPKGQQGASQN